MYTAPVVFPASLILEKYGYTTYLVIWNLSNGWSDRRIQSITLLGFKPMPWDLIAIGAVSSILLFLTGVFYFKKTERIFADVA